MPCPSERLRSTLLVRCDRATQPPRDFRSRESFEHDSCELLGGVSGVSAVALLREFALSVAGYAR
jgi:hypothetical protein